MDSGPIGWPFGCAVVRVSQSREVWTQSLRDAHLRVKALKRVDLSALALLAGVLPTGSRRASAPHLETGRLSVLLRSGAPRDVSSGRASAFRIGSLVYTGVLVP